MNSFLSNKSRICVLLNLFALVGLCFLLGSCNDQCEDRNTFSYYEPVYTPLSVIRSSIALDEPKPITGVGKIYFKDGYLFVNEPGEGIHVIDNHDPQNPLRKHFI